MTVYGIDDKTKLNLQHQDQNWLCWASVATAIAEYHRIEVPRMLTLETLFQSDQEVMAQAMFDDAEKKIVEKLRQYPEGDAKKAPLVKARKANGINSPRNPVAALKTVCGMNHDTVFDWDSRCTAEVEIGSRVSDLPFGLKQGLANGPMVAGITTHDDSTWDLSGKSEPYTWRHAVLLYAYDDDDGGTVSIADPAKKTEKYRYRTLSLRDFVHGFHYANISELGPKATKLLKNPPPTITARAYKLYSVSAA